MKIDSEQDMDCLVDVFMRSLNLYMDTEDLRSEMTLTVPGRSPVVS